MSDQITESLIKDLETLADDGFLPLEKRLKDTAIWYHRNKERISRDDALKRLDFLERFLDIYLELMAMTVDRIQLSEGRGRSQSLWLPNGVSVTGDVKKFG